MKFPNLQTGDTVFVLTPIWTEQRGNSSSNHQKYFIPYTVSKVTNQFFDIEELGRFKREDGQTHGVSRFDNQVYTLGEKTEHYGVVRDQSIEHREACVTQKLIDEVNYMITRYTVNHKVLDNQELQTLYSLLNKNAEQFSSFRKTEAA
ncbi:hypothetical protein [Vibrio gallicus]|uniref:hypothetical protein n=1 Tax=Vibrio gallicus TaxID=190897 RepID=UPI0021C47944|nr:hypothetical protein [Vibrio gallicus]